MKFNCHLSHHKKSGEKRHFPESEGRKNSSPAFSLKSGRSFGGERKNSAELCGQPPSAVQGASVGFVPNCSMITFEFEFINQLKKLYYCT